METGREYISASVVISRLNRLLDDVYCAELKRSLLFTQHAAEVIDQNSFGNTDDKQLHDLVELIIVNEYASDQMQLICSIADPYLLYSFDRTVKRSILFIRENIFFTNVPEPDGEFFRKFALFALEGKKRNLSLMKEVV